MDTHVAPKPIRDFLIMKSKSKSIVTVVTLLFHIVLLYWAFQQMN